MVPVGDFQIVYGNSSRAGEQIFVPRSNATITWPGNKGPPKDSPECGFHGELCPLPVDDGKSVKPASFYETLNSQCQNQFCIKYGLCYFEAIVFPIQTSCI